MAERTVEAEHIVKVGHIAKAEHTALVAHTALAERTALVAHITLAVQLIAVLVGCGILLSFGLLAAAVYRTQRLAFLCTSSKKTYLVSLIYFIFNLLVINYSETISSPFIN